MRETQHDEIGFGQHAEQSALAEGAVDMRNFARRSGHAQNRHAETGLAHAGKI